MNIGHGAEGRQQYILPHPACFPLFLVNKAKAENTGNFRSPLHGGMGGSLAGIPTQMQCVLLTKSLLKELNNDNYRHS